MKRFISAMAAAALAVSFFGSALTVSAAGSEKATPSGIAYSKIRSSIDSFIKEREAGLASCEVSVFDGEGVIFNGYYGFADIENKNRADAETVYEWGSTSKILVWISVMQQWERGNLDLNADVREYLPEGFLTKLQYPDEKITMLHLMSHNAGFQESYYENQQAAPDDVYDSLEDAVKSCQCYQAFHVGEYTAYSNWGNALAAYIVESTSGMDYATYVHRNIFVPLGMKHTSIDPQQKDNQWVAEKRHELMCYARCEDEKYNEDFGECRNAVQLFPAGAAMSTLEDLSKLGRAFVSEECPLFEKNSTRAKMFKATSFFGNTDTMKNCLGLWVEHRKVDTLGHGGNTDGCTANLEFDPVSGLGVAVLTNECGETAFCSGIPVLLYGHYTDRDTYRSVSGSQPDISGVYYCKRAICEGAASAAQYMGGLFPLSQNNDGSYSLKLFGLSFGEGLGFVPVGDNQYIMEDNGMEMLVTIKDGVFEMGYMDYIRSDTGSVPTVLCFGFILFGLMCTAAVLVKRIAFTVRKIRKTGKEYTAADKQIWLQQLIYGGSGVIFALYLLIVNIANPVFTAVSAVLAAVVALVTLVNSGMLCYHTIKSDILTIKKVKQYAWVALGFAYVAFIIGMPLYRFWTL